MDLHDEFERCVEWVARHLRFDVDHGISHFEATIRMLGVSHRRRSANTFPFPCTLFGWQLLPTFPRAGHWLSVSEKFPWIRFRSFRSFPLKKPLSLGVEASQCLKGVVTPFLCHSCLFSNLEQCFATAILVHFHCGAPHCVATAFVEIA